MVGPATPLYKGGGEVEFLKFLKKGDGSDFSSHKNGGFEKIGGFLKRKAGGYHLFSW